MKNAEVGDIWEFTAPGGFGIVGGARASIELTRREEGLEVWVYRWCYKDGSGAQCDWAPSFRKASDLVRIYFRGQCRVRFKKVRKDK